MNELNQLNRLARLYNVQTAYYGVGRKRVTASPETLLAVTKALGAPVKSFSDITSAIREKELSLKRRIIEPVTVVWEGARPEITITLPSEINSATCSGHLKLESGKTFEWIWRTADLPVIESTSVENQRFIICKITLPQRLPLGYHKFILNIAGKEYETLIISAPRRAFSPPDTEREWGAFLPLYALKTKNDWGSGDYSGLGAMADWVGERGGKSRRDAAAFTNLS